MTGWSEHRWTTRVRFRDAQDFRMCLHDYGSVSIASVDELAHEVWMHCDSLADAYTLANQIAEATGGWKE